MQAKLLQYVESMSSIADIRNMDINNPVLVTLEQPVTFARFITVAAMSEPSSMVVPINTTWVDLNPSSATFNKALKLRSNLSPVDSGVAGALPGFNQSWIELTEYDQIFEHPQYYVNSASGIQGPVGPTGPMGPAPDVDYDYIIAQVLAQIDVGGAQLVALRVTGAPSSVFENTTFSGNITITAEYNDGANTTYRNIWLNDANLNVIKSPTAAFNVVQKNPSDPTAGTTVTANAVLEDTECVITFEYSEGTTTVEATPVLFTVRNKVPVSIAVNGASSVNEGQNSTYTATVSYNDGSTQSVTPTWSCSPSIGTISAGGVLSASLVAANTAGTVNASYTQDGVTVNGSRNVTVVNVAAPVYSKYGTASKNATKNAALIQGLTGQGAANSIPTTFTLDSGAPNSGISMYFAYPKAWGMARFEDAASPGFYGGWDGAKGDPTDPALSGPVEITVNTDGTDVVWYLFQTDWDGLGPVTWNVTVQP